MTADILRSNLPTHVGGIYLAAADMLRLMDRPGMTIEQLRGSTCTTLFRDQVNTFNAWLRAAATLDKTLTEPERQALLQSGSDAT